MPCLLYLLAYFLGGVLSVFVLTTDRTCAECCRSGLVNQHCPGALCCVQIPACTPYFFLFGDSSQIHCPLSPQCLFLFSVLLVVLSRLLLSAFSRICKQVCYFYLLLFLFGVGGWRGEVFGLFCVLFCFSLFFMSAL